MVGKNGLMTDTESEIRPVSRATLPQEIVKTITDLIMRRVWKPGDMIPSEKDLAVRFGVGRSTIREAVKSLAILGVFESRAGGGSFVREPNSELLSGALRWGLMLSERNLDDLMDVRALIEIECVGRAAERRTPETLELLAAAIEEMKNHEGSADLFMAIDMKFHNAVSRAADNPIFESISSTIQAMVRIWYPKTYYIPETKSQTIAEHLRIADALIAQDRAAAVEAMRVHLILAGERLRRVLPPA
jgi:GntR family transcriptional repressor for pyruvate dehydrogenase complex